MEEERVGRTNEFENVGKMQENAKFVCSISIPVPMPASCFLSIQVFLSCFLNLSASIYHTLFRSFQVNDTYQNFFLSNTMSKYNDISVYSYQPMYVYSYLSKYSYRSLFV